MEKPSGLWEENSPETQGSAHAPARPQAALGSRGRRLPEDTWLPARLSAAWQAGTRGCCHADSPWSAGRGRLPDSGPRGCWGRAARAAAAPGGALSAREMGRAGRVAPSLWRTWGLDNNDSDFFLSDFPFPASCLGSGGGKKKYNSELCGSFPWVVP